MRFLKFAALFTLASIPLLLLRKKSEHAPQELRVEARGIQSHSALTYLPLESEEIFEYDLRTE